MSRHAISTTGSADCAYTVGAAALQYALGNVNTASYATSFTTVKYRRDYQGANARAFRSRIRLYFQRESGYFVRSEKAGRMDSIAPLPNP
jgi:hypothetical protein